MSSTGEMPPASGVKERPSEVEKPKITDFFKPKPKKRGRGRPRKTKALPAAAGPPPAPVPEKKKARGSYLDYKDPVVKAQLENEVDYFLATGNYLSSAEDVSSAPLILIPAATIRDNAKRRQASQAAASAAEQKKPAAEECFAKADLFQEQTADRRGVPSLLTEAQRRFIASTAKFRDEAKNGMTRKELIQLILQLSGSSDMKQCANHLDYLIRAKKLPELKNSGRVKSAQATTTKRACIRVEQQLRWHNLIEVVWAVTCFFFVKSR